MLNSYIRTQSPLSYQQRQDFEHLYKIKHKQKDHPLFTDLSKSYYGCSFKWNETGCVISFDTPKSTKKSVAQSVVNGMLLGFQSFPPIANYHYYEHKPCDFVSNHRVLSSLKANHSSEVTFHKVKY